VEAARKKLQQEIAELKEQIEEMATLDELEEIKKKGNAEVEDYKKRIDAEIEGKNRLEEARKALQRQLSEMKETLDNELNKRANAEKTIKKLETDLVDARRAKEEVAEGCI